MPHSHQRTTPAAELHPVGESFPGVRIVLALFAAAFLVCGCAKTVVDRPKAVNGVLDLSAWNLAEKGVIDLDGDWEFHWGRLLAPLDFNRTPHPGVVEYLRMPTFWNDPAVTGTVIPGHGFATMRLTVRLGRRPALCALKIPQMYTSYRLWVNGMPMAGNGQVGTDRAHTIPQFLPKVVILAPGSDTLELVVQVANFHHPRGGMWSSIQLGTETQIVDRQRLLAAFDFFLLGGLLIMAFYHIGIFLFRRMDRASLYFGILCLVMALRVPFEGERLMIGLFPGISWEINEKISYLTFYSSVVIVGLYIYHLFPDIYSRAMMRACIAIGVAACVIVLAVQSQVYFYSRYPYYVNLVFWVLYDCYVIFRAVVMRKDGASYLLVGMAILAVTVFSDVFYHSRVIDLGNLSSFGMFVFTLSQAILLSDRSSKALSRIEMLSSEKTRLFANSIDIISSILLASSTRLYEFTQNVTRISLMLARGAGIPADGIEEIRIASLLHDIGMIGIPDDLAGSVRPATEAERHIVESHPRKSMEIIAGLKDLSGVKSIIAQHHERFDGSGYPNGLAGRDIAVGAQIIGLVDDFVTMLGRREFQSDDKKSGIVAELTRRRGTLYEPRLVDGLIRLIDRENLVYVIDEKDIHFELKDDTARWVFPSNVNYEMIVVEKVIAAMKSRVSIGHDLASMIEFGLGEIIRNAIIHGNKYDESKRVTVTFAVRERENRRLLEFRVADQGNGMDFARYRHFKESRLKLYDMTRETKQLIQSQESAECSDALTALNRKLQDFLLNYYINYNRFRHIDSPESSGGVGLIQVMQTFDNVDFQTIVADDKRCGMEVVLEKFID